MDGIERDANFLANKQNFSYFLSPENGDNLYMDKVEDMVNSKKNRLVVNLRDINEYDPNLRRNILQSPMDYIPCWEEALKDYITHNNVSVDKQRVLEGEYKIGLKGSFGAHRLTPQRMLSSSIGTMVCCEGIVTKVSLVRPKVKETVHFCEATQQFTTQKYRDSTSLTGPSTNSTFPTTDANGNNLTTEFGLSTFADHQKIYIQDMPERTEPGSMPQTVECILDEDLVDCCKPGDRVQIIGIYRALSGRRAVGQTSGKFQTVVLVNNVVKIGIGAKKSSADQSLSAADIKSIKKMSKKKDVFMTLANSVIPSIHGHDYIKKAIVLQLLGGIAKDLDNGTHLRGDINILMIGDPSCGKSQLLRGVMNIGRLVINTTGRGSSGVGLTAAVTMDRDSGEKKLEAGAMVLADGGIVCIDEFDKMTDADRTAIHEVMEQQTVTIAKAGIHTSLNARCSVIAAANPVYGMYDRFKKPHENIGLPDSLLSRFDLLFIVLDKIDTKIDRNISDHVLKMHLTPYNAADEIDPMGDGIHDEDDEDEDADTTVWSKQRVRKHKIFTNEFSRKYIEFCKKQYKPKLTDVACEEIANRYGQLREEERNQTLPITARCLETIIRLSTAHAKMRLQKEVQLQDVEAAMEILSFALTNDADPQNKSKKGRVDQDGDANMNGDDEDEDDEEGDASSRNRNKKKKKRRKRRGDNEDDDGMDEDEEDEEKMQELLDDGDSTNNRRKKKRKRKQPDGSSQEQEEERGTPSKRRKQKGKRVDEHRVKGVTTTLATYFRVNRVGQIKKEVLLRKMNADGADMNQDELNQILKHLHDQNKCFFLDPVVHQL